MTKEIEQKVKLELENEKLQEQLNTFEATEVKQRDKSTKQFEHET